jgi:hypothetical protein
LLEGLGEGNFQNYRVRLQKTAMKRKRRSSLIKLISPPPELADEGQFD